MTMRCNYSDESIIRFDDDFGRTALCEKIGLNDERYRKFLADRYFHAGSRRNETLVQNKNQLFRGRR